MSELVKYAESELSLIGMGADDTDVNNRQHLEDRLKALATPVKEQV